MHHLKYACTQILKVVLKETLKKKKSKGSEFIDLATGGIRIVESPENMFNRSVCSLS